MSAKLVKKSLDLFNDDPSKETISIKKKSRKAKDPMSLISTKKKGVKKELKKLKKQFEGNQVKKKPKQGSFEDYLYNQPEDYTEACVSSLCKISKISKVADQATTTIVKHHLGLGRKEKLKNKKMTDKKDKEQSVFTDEDFEKFFAEYNDPLNNS